MPETPLVMPGRGTGLLPRELAGFIFEDVARTSAIQQLVEEQPIPVEGLTIPVMTGEPVAQWVSEAGRKPITNAAVGFKTMDPEKLAAIIYFSQEFLRADSVGLYDMLRPKLAQAFAIAFDWATIMGLGGDGTGSAPFDNYMAQTTNAEVLGTATAAAGGIWKDLINANSKVPNRAEAKRYRVNRYVLDEFDAESVFLGAVDANGRPIFVDYTSPDLPRNLVGRPFEYAATFADRPDNASGTGGTSDGAGASGDTPPVGIGFDRRQYRWGRGMGIQYSLSTEATLFDSGGNPISLWQENMVAMRAEAEFGWIVNDTDAAVLLYPEGSTLVAAN